MSLESDARHDELRGRSGPSSAVEGGFSILPIVLRGPSAASILVKHG